MGWTLTWVGMVWWISGNEGGWSGGGMPMVQGVEVQCE